MHAITIKPYANAQKMLFVDFWKMIDAQETKHDKYTYKVNATCTNFDVVYNTAEAEKCSVDYSDFFAIIDQQIGVDGIAIVLQHCDDFDTVLVIEGNRFVLNASR